MKVRLVDALIVLLVFSLSIAACAQSAGTEEQASAALHEAEKYIELDQSGEALLQLDQLLLQYPGSGSEKWAKLRKVEALYHLGRYDEAIALAASLIEKFQSSDPLLAAWAHCHTGSCYMAKQDWQAALSQLQITEQMNGSDLYDQGPAQAARVRLGEIYLHLQGGQADAASAASVPGFSADNEQSSAASIAMASAVYAEIGDIKAALACYERLQKEYPLQKKETASAACEVSSRWVYGIMAKAEDIPEGDAAKMEELALSVRAHAPSESFLVAKAESALGYYFLHLADRPEQAAKTLSALLEAYPSTVFTKDSTFMLAGALRLNGDPAGALALYRKIIDQYSPCGYVAPSEYASVGCLTALGRDDEAASTLQRLISRPGDDDWRQMARTRLAGLLAGKRRYQEALGVLAEARNHLLEKKGSSTDAHLQESLDEIDRQMEHLTKLLAGRVVN